MLTYLKKGQMKTKLANYKKRLDKLPQSEEKTVCPTTGDTILDPVDKVDIAIPIVSSAN